jgi:hypothetical protein
MGNLPRSRPGRRSDKRAAEVKPAKSKTSRASGTAAKTSKATAKKATARKTARPAAGGKTKREAAPKPPAARAKPRAATAGAKSRTTGGRAKGPAATTPSVGIPTDERAPRTAVRDERVEAPQGSDPITAALRLGMAVGDAGLKAVAKLAQRLPRP